VEKRACFLPGCLTALLAVRAGEASAGPILIPALLGEGVNALATDADGDVLLYHLALLVLLAQVDGAIRLCLAVRIYLRLCEKDFYKFCLIFQREKGFAQELNY